MSQIRIKKYDIDAGEKLSGKRIVFLSDFHEAKDGELNDAIISAVKKASPDVVLLGGDMINGRDMFIEMEPAINLINALAEHFPVYYSFGNHERKIICNIYGNKDVWEPYLEALDDRVKFLRNAHEEIMDGLDVYGIDIPLKYYKRFKYPQLTGGIMNKVLGKKDDSKYTILLGHTPDFIKGYSEWGADLVLAGHFHGGLVRLPLLGGMISPRLHPFPKYDYGLYKKEDTQMIVTNGIGQHSIKIRFNNKPEIVLVSFKSNKENL